MLDNEVPTIIWRKGKRVILRPHLESDLLHYQRWINDPANNYYLSVTWPMHERGQLKWLESVTESNQDNLCLAICTHEGVLLGNIALNVNDRNKSAVTGTLIGAHKKQGYATDAKMLILDYAFNWLGLRKVTSEIIAHNHKSQGYADKCGYRHMATIEKEIFRDGEWQDEEHYVVFRDEWLPIWEEYCSDWTPSWKNNT